MSWLVEHLRKRRAEAKNRPAHLAQELRSRAVAQPAPRPFLKALTDSPHKPGSEAPAVIAELKFRSPSRGRIRPTDDVEEVAAGYARHGAAAMSVLVDDHAFGGHFSHIERARRASGLPVLAKGFLVDPVDVVEARAAGADAVLLLVACLERPLLVEMLEQASSLGMAALVEVHSEQELVLLEGLPVELIGVNHRNLHTLSLDMGLSERLAGRLPKPAVRVAESGLSTREDLMRMAKLGYHAVLVGSHLMAHPDPGAALGDLLGVRL